MSNIAVSLNVDLVQMICGECGIVFAVPDYFQQERLKTGKGWYCPNGHGRVYKESETDRLRKLLEQANKKNTDLLERTRMAEDAKKAAVMREGKERAEKKRLLTRTHGGVCPHCNRTFRQLARHMETKHKEAE